MQSAVSAAERGRRGRSRSAGADLCVHRPALSLAAAGRGQAQPTACPSIFVRSGVSAIDRGVALAETPKARLRDFPSRPGAGFLATVPVQPVPVADVNVLTGG
jgi:hypothetical protein